MRQIRSAEVVAHGSASAARVEVRRTATRHRVAFVHGAEVYAVAREATGIRHRLVQMRGGEQDEPAGRNYQAHLATLDRLRQPRLLPRVGLDVLRRTGTVLRVPLVVVVDIRAVLDGIVEIVRMEGEAVALFNVPDRQPPVDLAERRRVPRVAVRVEGVGNAR